MNKNRIKGKMVPLLFLAALFFLLSACGNAQDGRAAEKTEESAVADAEQEETMTGETESSEVNMQDNRQEMTEITLTFGDTVVTAQMDNSETTRAFLDRLPLTISMNRYADREYYASIPELPENEEEIPDFENGDITYYTAGKSLAIFFGNEGNSSQSDLIRMGRITTDLSAFDGMPDAVTVTIEAAETEKTEMTEYDFSDFSNVELIGAEPEDFSSEELAVLYQQAKYCQAMTEADIDTMRELVSEDMVFTHMSGRQQSREEYFADVENGSLRYFTIGMENPVVEVDGDMASVTYTSVLNANAYGTRGTFRMSGTHWYEKRDGEWIAVNGAE